ncbi:MAG: sterol desaturase family protein [Saprospiraceae bacterium]|nr:sterol desaturase family protein [Saprospiraceae bacterium]
MEEYANVMNYAIPFFMVLIAVEYGASCFMRLKVNRLFDTISSLSSGVTNVIKDVLGLSIVIISYGWMVDHVALMRLESAVLLYIIAFIGLDFAGYWTHRFSHVVNVFWNRHIIHHSSEEYNLACALRQSVSEIFAIFTILFLPMALLGVPAKVVGTIAPLHLFAQFWYHTRLIGKMGFLEYIIVTPSHHRVHHAINPIYMDKNYSQIFIIWDKIFGTFQPELDTEIPVFGVTKPVQTWNPWLINYQHIWQLIKDAWRASSLWDKVRIWFMPTGWRPADVATKYPIHKTDDIYRRPKYDTKASVGLKVWSTVQLFITLALMMHFFNHIVILTPLNILLYGFFLFLTIFSYTSLMDGSILAIIAEGIKITLAYYILSINGFSWFGIDQIWSEGTIIIIFYLTISLAASVYFFTWDRAKQFELPGKYA